MNYKLFNDKKFVISSTIIKNLDKDLTLNEFFVLLYFINSDDAIFDAEKISNIFNMSLEDVMLSFNNLLSKELIELKQGKDLEDRITDIVSLEVFYNKILKNIDSEIKEDEEKSIFDLIEEEFDRKLSPMDLEIINAWFDIGTSRELIEGALKEASYNGVKTLKFMDQKIYEWHKKGFKNMDDVHSYLTSKDNKSSEELFDYDWLDDDE